MPPRKTSTAAKAQAKASAASQAQVEVRTKAPIASKAQNAAAELHAKRPEIKTANRPDEWKIEQGLSGAALPVLDMTGPETKALDIQVFGPLTKDEKAIEAVGDREKLFTRERKGWVG